MYQNVTRTLSPRAFSLRLDVYIFGDEVLNPEIRRLFYQARPRRSYTGYGCCHRSGLTRMPGVCMGGMLPEHGDTTTGQRNALSCPVLSEELMRGINSSEG